MAQNSFDIVSEIPLAELDHAIDQARKELGNRYDFKGTAATLNYEDDKKKALIIEGDNDYQLHALLDMLRIKLAKRKLSQQLLDTSENAQKRGMVMRQRVVFKQGLAGDKGKLITSLIRESFPKIKSQIQGESVRVTSTSRDELQSVMQLLREAKSIDFPIQFTNFK